MKKAKTKAQEFEEGLEYGGQETTYETVQATTEPKKATVAKDGGNCQECDEPVAANVAKFSKQKFGMIVCFDHQKLEKYKKFAKK